MKKIKILIYLFLLSFISIGVNAANVNVKDNKMLGLLDENEDWVDVDTYTTIRTGIKWYDNDEDKKISQSDKICIDTECFYVINNEAGYLTMIAQYNLYAGRLYTSETEYTEIKSTDEGYLKQTSNYMGLYYNQTENKYEYTYPMVGINFADDYYWKTDDFEYGAIYNEESNIYAYVNEYVNNLNKFGLQATGRIPNFADNTLINWNNWEDYAWFYSNSKTINDVYYYQDFWIDYVNKANYVYSVDDSWDVKKNNAAAYGVGIRPVIEVKEDELYNGVTTYKDKCVVVTGTGKNIGDEIECGTEHFYIMSNDGKTVQMMAKYNLYVGANWNKYIVDDNLTYDQLKSKYNLIDINSDSMSNLSPYEYGTYGYLNNYANKLYTYKNITITTPGFGYQNKIALGVTGEKGNANYPIYGTTLLFANYTPYLEPAISTIDNVKNGYTNFEFSNTNDVKYYLDNYKTNLEKLGLTINNVDIITISELNTLVENITKKTLPLEQWYLETVPIKASQNFLGTQEDYETSTKIGDLKEYLSDEYSWIWNTSYWTRTLHDNYLSLEGVEVDETEVYFVSSTGEICYSSSDCYGSIPRAGIRPVVTMSASNIVYNVYTKTEGNGNVSFANENGLVKLTITPEKGYIVKSIKVTDAKGNEITVTDLSFTMPDSDVTIEVTFEKETIIDKVVDKIEDIVNPDTGTYEDIIFIGILAIFCISTIVIIKTKKHNKFIFNK